MNQNRLIELVLKLVNTKSENTIHKIVDLK